MSISDVDTEVKSSKSQKHKDGYSVMLCYATGVCTLSCQKGTYLN